MLEKRNEAKARLVSQGAVSILIHLVNTSTATKKTSVFLGEIVMCAVSMLQY